MPGGFFTGFKDYELNKYPEGTHCDHKIYASFMNTVRFSFAATCFHISIERARRVYDVVRWFPKIMIPGALVGITWGGTACYLTALRQKDEIKNYYVAGVASGAVLGASINSPYYGAYAAFYGGVVSAFYKYLKLNGTSMWPTWPKEGIMSDKGLGFESSLLEDCSRVPDPGPLTGNEEWNTKSNYPYRF